MWSRAWEMSLDFRTCQGFSNWLQGHLSNFSRWNSMCSKSQDWRLGWCFSHSFEPIRFEPLDM
jgi:hypothetical protein